MAETKTYVKRINGHYVKDEEARSAASAAQTTANTALSTANEAKSGLSGKQNTLSFDGAYNASTNKVATVSTVTTKIAEVVASAPTDYDTLKEIADYIASDKTGAAQLSNTVAQNTEDLQELSADVQDIVEGRQEIGLATTATDATKLNGKEASHYLNYSNLTNKPTSLKNPTSLTVGIVSNGSETTQTYDGSTARTIGTQSIPVSYANKATRDASGNVITDTYAKLASPTFTGTPKAPTAAAGTNTTQIATTAFVYTGLNTLTNNFTNAQINLSAYNFATKSDLAAQSISISVENEEMTIGIGTTATA